MATAPADIYTLSLHDALPICPAGMSDTEWQIRNWYNFVWLCGDSLVEQAVHSVDKVAWAMNDRSEEHTSELQSHSDLVCRLLLEKKKTSCPKRLFAAKTRTSS